MLSKKTIDILSKYADIFPEFLPTLSFLAEPPVFPAEYMNFANRQSSYDYDIKMGNFTFGITFTRL
ncbi:MAG: hypothetical protein ACHQRM_07535 [Bacteroidia bacterium]